VSNAEQTGAVCLLDAVTQGGAAKGADRGIWGIRWMWTAPRDGDLGRIIVSVMGRECLGARMVGTVEREKALGGVLVTLAKPTRDMIREAASRGFASTGPGQFRKIMVKRVEELLHGAHDDGDRLPPLGRAEGFGRAPKERSGGGEQAVLFT
jgi:site-specific DNA-methyltransferase (adenine-specific)